MKKIFLALTLATTSFSLVAASDTALPDTARLQAMLTRFVPVEITADVSALPPRERQALKKLVEAARIMDTLYLRQVWTGNESLLQDLRGSETPLGLARYRYFMINKGPWSRLDQNVAFIPGVPAKPEAGSFYPANTTKTQVEEWLQHLPDTDSLQARSYFTTIRRGPEGRFLAIPYSIEYHGELARASALLRDASRLTTQPALKAYLEKRAEAFLSNNYYESDVAWMKLDASIEPTLGPYETYEDEWFGYKAAFEAFVGLRDEAETVKLSTLSSALQDIENHLPVAPQYRNTKLGALAPIRVVNAVIASGDANHPVYPFAFNLPNDERVIKDHGTKRVMLKNIQEAKFTQILVPVSQAVLTAADQGSVSFDAFFTHILMHELMHGLGPQAITLDGRATTVRQELKNLYTAIEEAKADIAGLWALQYLTDKGVIAKGSEGAMYTTFLATSLRTIRFGITEAHGRASALQVNFLLDHGAIKKEIDSTFSVDQARIREGVTALTREILTIEARGDYAKAKDLLARLAIVRPDVKRVLDRLTGVPVDIEPRFTTAEELAR